MHEVCSCGLPHSDTRGSADMCSSPRLFAAYRVLLRLPVPRHSPCALFHLTFASGASVRLRLLSLPSFRPSNISLSLLSQPSIHVFLSFVCAFTVTVLPLLPQGPYGHFDAFFVYAVFKVRRSTSCFFAACPQLFNILAAACSPTPSPAQYHRPSGS